MSNLSSRDKLLNCTLITTTGTATSIAMSTEERHARHPVGTSRFTPSESARQSVQQPFRFGNLPKEVRDRIYRLSLVNETPTSIVVDEPSGFDGEPMSEAHIFGNPDLVQLITRIDHFRGDRFTIDMGLTRINSTIHDEAAAVLYGCNTFRFTGEYSWTNFVYFHQHLTRVGRQYLRKLEISFPHIIRNNSAQITSQFDESSVRGIKILRRLPSLAKLTFHVGDDIMTANINLLRQIRDSKQCSIVMDIRKALLYYDHDGYDDRPVRISSTAIQKMRKWNWNIRGHYELVDQHHRFRKETSWLRWSQMNRQKGLDSGLISEPNLFYEPFLF